VRASVACVALLLWTVAARAAAADAAPARVLDRFDDASAWTVATSDQVTAALRPSEGPDHAHALCLDFDFHGVSGYAGMRRPLRIDYPANYEFDLRVRGRAPDNALQFKLADAANENVWWVNRAEFAFPDAWTTERFRRRQISFAWGPTPDKTLRRSDSVELTVYAVDGGKGEVCFADLSFRELALPPATWPTPVAKASSSAPSHPAANAIDGNAKTYWRSGSRDPEQSLTLDLGAEREFGGLVLRWIDGAFASRYDVDLSDDATHWRTVRSVTRGNGGSDPLDLHESEARYVRIAMHGGNPPYALSGVDVEDLAFGASANAFFAALAKSSPRGRYPRGFYAEQTYWTLVGIDGGHETGLLSEDGAIEVGRGGFSIAPFVVDRPGHVSSWADATIDHSLADGYLPIPSVRWQAPTFTLTTTAFADGDREDSRMIARYVLANTTDAPRTLVLALVVQPFQVNPSVQFLNTPGGVSPIHDLALDPERVTVDGKPRVFGLAPADAAFATPFDAGMAPEHLATVARGPRSSAASSTRDTTGLASGALLYRIRLDPHASRTVGLVVPLDGPTRTDRPGPQQTPQAWIADRERRVSAAWRESLDRVGIRVPESAEPTVDTLRTALADILISRDGPALRPGTRSYARSWIRDGAMMATALLRLGHADAAREYLQWYAPYQFRNGKVPCCVDRRGSDPVPENDSQGELIHLAAEVHRYTGDRALLESMWPHVDGAVRYMDRLRDGERTDANRRGERRAFFGLMPASISHEGYSAKPMHSYWDDFWSLTGYDDAIGIARALGRDDDAARIARSRDQFRGDLYASIRRTVEDHRIEYLPGCAELGDFDATSTTIALSPADQQAALPQDLLHATFERYWKEFVRRRDGEIAWKDYTPYEWRTVGSFVRLGWRDRAQQAIAFFMQGRRPPEWNQWAEVVGRDPRESRFVGDMPHGWVASDFIRSILDLFAYERASDHAIVIAAGIPSTWLDGDGVAVDGLRTPYGPLTYSLARANDGSVRLELRGAAMRLPPGGIVLQWPGDAAPPPAHIGGRAIPWERNELRVHEWPAVVEIAAPKLAPPSG
jgi:F5/8 type C domain